MVRSDDTLAAVRERGALDATIESPKTEAFTRDTPREALASMEAVAAAVAFLADQDVRGMTHELVVTPSGDRWIP